MVYYNQVARAVRAVRGLLHYLLDLARLIFSLLPFKLIFDVLTILVRLKGDSLHSLDIGAPILFRHITKYFHPVNTSG